MLEAIGGLTIVIGLGYLLLRHLSNKGDRERENDILIANSEACQIIIREYNKQVNNNTATIPYYELRRKLNKIIEDPQERAAAIQNLQDKKKSEEDSIRRFTNRMKENRKFAYAYDTAIFTIFDTKERLKKIELEDKISQYYRIDKPEANKILELWIENELIERGLFKTGYFEITAVLTNEEYKLVDSDLTRADWLEMNGKELDHVE